MQNQLNAAHAEQILTIVRKVIGSENCFAVGTETGEWTHGIRFTLYDVRSSISGMDHSPFDGITWDIEEALQEAGYPVTGIMKGKKLCMVDVDCRKASAGELTSAADANSLISLAFP